MQHLTCFDKAHAEAIGSARELFSDPQMEGKLAGIESNFAFFPETITLLAGSTMALDKSAELSETQKIVYKIQREYSWSLGTEGEGIRWWFGRTSRFAAGGKTTAITPDMLQRAVFIREDQCIATRQLTLKLSISKESVDAIIRALGYLKVYARWVFRNQRFRQWIATATCMEPAPSETTLRRYLAKCAEDDFQETSQNVREILSSVHHICFLLSGNWLELHLSFYILHVELTYCIVMLKRLRFSLKIADEFIAAVKAAFAKTPARSAVKHWIDLEDDEGTAAVTNLKRLVENKELLLQLRAISKISDGLCNQIQVLE
ncbi:hypothetical protein ANN_18911 [Periplaneta americana]|uniref:Spindle pole body component n=1 Tax=Periplaneta americana TaxID=6978 RepID=A0ABQ8SRD5_PERAM|nr:hypothetical protein ANN_18911 [Periplaneta americana]